MRKVLFAAAALLLCAAPVAAQEALAPSEPAPAAVPAVPAPAPAAALNPTPEHVKQLVREQEARHTGQSPIGSKDWWYLVAAIAIGVIIAAVLL